MPTIFSKFHHRTSSILYRTFITTGILAWLTASILALAPIFPHILYRLSPQTPHNLTQAIGQAIDQTPPSPSPSPPEPAPTPNLPPQDPSLPDKNLLIIEKIGIQGQIHQGENWQEILRNGIWLTPNWGTPSNNQNPIILASHRWGYLDWTHQFRRQNSFYNLPKLEKNNSVKIIWQQRQYIYQITDQSQGKQPTHLNSDLILYTCKLYDSPIRLFYYATRTN